MVAPSAASALATSKDSNSGCFTIDPQESMDTDHARSTPWSAFQRAPRFSQVQIKTLRKRWGEAIEGSVVMLSLSILNPEKTTDLDVAEWPHSEVSQSNSFNLEPLPPRGATSDIASMHRSLVQGETGPGDWILKFAIMEKQSGGAGKRGLKAIKVGDTGEAMRASLAKLKEELLTPKEPECSRPVLVAQNILELAVNDLHKEIYGCGTYIRALKEEQARLCSSTGREGISLYSKGFPDALPASPSDLENEIQRAGAEGERLEVLATALRETFREREPH
jgi:hypothetical protein